MSEDKEVKTANRYILDVCDSELNPVIKNAIYWRLKKGEEAYGHQLRPLDDTTTWGTKKDSWLEMAEEEIADAIIYVLTNYLRLVENGTADETSFQLSMHICRTLSELHHLTGMIPPE
tara:strand:- start:1272 stop:1625 length:354 start_codon:yes stop_codon:yes gene_type:complete